MKNVTQVAAKLGVSTKRVRALCIQGRIPGAQKIGRDWVLPDKISVTAAERKRPGKIRMRG